MLTLSFVDFDPALTSWSFAVTCDRPLARACAHLSIGGGLQNNVMEPAHVRWNVSLETLFSESIGPRVA
jgi:hypothetical protein